MTVQPDEAESPRARPMTPREVLQVLIDIWRQRRGVDPNAHVDIPLHRETNIERAANLLGVSPVQDDWQHIAAALQRIFRVDIDKEAWRAAIEPTSVAMPMFRNMYRWSNEAHLRGWPEMSLCPSDEAKERAVREVHDGMYDWRFAITLVVHALVLLFMFFGVEHAIRSAVPALAGWSSRVSAAVLLVGYTVFIVVALRSATVKALRRKLLAAGISVCVKCGYDLRGVERRGERRCPECGARSTSSASPQSAADDAGPDPP